MMNINCWISRLFLLVLLTRLKPVHGGNCLIEPDSNVMPCTCCKSGFNGLNCTQLCPHCETRVMSGNICRKKCTDGYYGGMCDMPCSTNCMRGISGKTICDKKDGTCDNECIPGYFGLQCNLECSINCHEKKCLQKDGTCNSCKENRYYGKQCSVACSDGCYNGTCLTNGKCIGGCKDGYYGDTCGNSCGLNCKDFRCSENMTNKYICTDGCNDGFTSISCSTTCPVHCSKCHQDTGRCISCMPDYVKHCQSGDCETGIVSCVLEESLPAWVSIIVILVAVTFVVTVVFCIIGFFVWRRFNRNIPLQENIASADSPLLSLLSVTEETVNNSDTMKGASARRKNAERRTNHENEEQKLIEALHVKTKSEVEIRTKDMLPTSFTGMIVGKMKHGQRWITITGRPGEGKSIAAFIALKELQEKGRHVFHVKSPEEFAAVITRYSRPVILLNKIFSNWGREQIAYTKWKDALSGYCNDNNARRYEQDIDITGNIGTTVILVEHDYCLKPALEYLETLKEFITRDSHFVNMSKPDVLTFDEITHICQRIITSDVKGINKDTVRDLCNKQEQLAIPQVCRLFEILRRDNSNLSAVAYLRSPLDFLNNKVRALMQAENIDLFKEMINNDGRINEEFAAESPQIADELIRRYLRKGNGYFMFLNQLIYDSFELNICKKYPLYVIENCSLSVLKKRFIIMPHHSAQGTQSDEHVYISVQSTNAKALAKRFGFEIERKNLLVLSHSACSNKWFISEMMKQCKLEMYEIIGLTDIFSRERFLISLASNRSSELLKYTEHKTAIFQSTLNTSLVLLGVCKYAASKVLDYLSRKCKLDINVKLDDKGRTPLMIAAETKDPDFVKKIMSLNPDLNTADKDGATVLHYLCGNGLDLAVGEAITKGVNIDVTDKLGLSLLHYADRVNEMNVVELLLNKGAKPDARLIAAACRIWDIRIVKVLFKKSGAVNMKLGQRYTPLLSACAGGNVAVISYLIKTGASVNQCNDFGLSPLHMATSHCRPDAVAALLHRNADVSLTDAEGETPLHYAAEAGSKECVEILLPSYLPPQYNYAASFKVDVNTRSNEGYTSLHMAAKSRSKDCVNLLLKAKALLHVTTGEGFTPLHIAAGKGSIECVQSLLDADAKVNTENKYAYTPLHDAAKGGFTKTLEVLLRAGADVKAQNVFGQTALHKASEVRSKECLALLIQFEAEVNAQTNLGETALHISTESKSTACVAYLLKVNADVNLQDNMGFQPVHTAAKSGSEECLELLLAAGADVNARDRQGETPLHKAAMKGFETCMKYLLDRGANVNEQNIHKQMPLHQSIASGWTECSMRLLDAKADVNAQNSDDDTPLLIALRSGESHTFVESLLKAGANVNKQNSTGNAPLHVAAEHGLNECINILCKWGSKVNIQNRTGDTPLHLAVQSERKECVVDLLKANALSTIRNKSGFSPRYSAVKNCNKELNDLLLKQEKV